MIPSQGHKRSLHEEEMRGDEMRGEKELEAVNLYTTISLTFCSRERERETDGIDSCENLVICSPHRALDFCMDRKEVRKEEGRDVKLGGINSRYCNKMYNKNKGPMKTRSE